MDEANDDSQDTIKSSAWQNYLLEIVGLVSILASAFVIAVCQCLYIQKIK